MVALKIDDKPHPSIPVPFELQSEEYKRGTWIYDNLPVLKSVLVETTKQREIKIRLNRLVADAVSKGEDEREYKFITESPTSVRFYRTK